MSSAERQHPKDAARASRRAHSVSHTQRSDRNNGRPQPSGSTNSSRTSEGYPRPERSVFTCVGETCANLQIEPSDTFDSNDRRRRRNVNSRGHQPFWGEISPSGEALDSPGTGRTVPSVDRARNERGETPRSSLQTTYRRNLMGNEGGRSGRTRLDHVNRYSSSDSPQLNPITFFTQEDIENANTNRPFESSGELQTTKIVALEETIKKRKEEPDWIVKKSNTRKNLTETFKIGTTESDIAVKKEQNESLIGGGTSNSAASPSNFQPKKPLDPQDLMNKVKEISDNRRTYYVQKLGSDTDDLLNQLLKSLQRDSTESLFSLPVNLERDGKPQAIAGSNLKFIELPKRKTGSVTLNATKTDNKAEEKVLRVNKCERSVPPIDVYKKDLIINVPIHAISPVKPHDTVDAPSCETVLMINQICDGIEEVFKDMHVGFSTSQEQIKTEENAAKQQYNKIPQRTDSEEQDLMELKMSLLPAMQSARRSTDTRRSLQSLGSRYSSRGSMGDLQPSPQTSLTSLPQEPQMDTEELIQILNRKYDSKLGSPNGTTSSNSAGNDMKMLYSSAQLKRQVSVKTVETIVDKPPEPISTRYDQKSISSGSGIGSVNKNNLRRFSAKVQIPTDSQIDITGESTGGKMSENDIEPVKVTTAQQRAQSKTSTTSSASLKSSKIKEAEKQAIAEMIKTEFGHMQLGSITMNLGSRETRSYSKLDNLQRAHPTQNTDVCPYNFEEDQQLMVESGTTKHPLLHKAKFPMEIISEEQRPPADRHIQRRSRNPTSIYGPPAEEEQYKYGLEDMEGQISDECNEWVELTPSSLEGANEDEIEEENTVEHNDITDDSEELRLLFPSTFMLSTTSLWWKKPNFSAEYRKPITKEKAPEFDNLRDQLKAFLEEYENNYSRFETVYRWGDPKDPPVWNKKYRSPFLRPPASSYQEPNRFHFSDKALSMRNSKECTDKRDRPPGYSTATFYVEPTKWWNLASVRRYVLRKELAKHNFERHRIRLGLRAKPVKYSASLILQCKKRKIRKPGQVCRRRKDRNKTWVAMFMKRNLPRSTWKDLKTKYELARSLQYRQRHHWNPFHPLNKPSIDGKTRLGWYGQSLIRKNNITFLGQFSRGPDDKQRAEVRPITDSEIRDKWQRDIMEMAYVAYCTNKLITEELQFLVMIAFWLGVAIDEFSYFIKFVMSEMGREHEKKTVYQKKHPEQFRHRKQESPLDGTEGPNPKIWEKILEVCDKTLFMLRRGLLPVQGGQTDQDGENTGPKPEEKFTETAVTIPWYENTKLQKTNRRLLDSIALAYPDFFYLANKNNKYYHVELDADEAKWFPIRYYDADTGEYNFISHKHPKWPDWKFLHMTSHGNAFQMNPITFIPYNEDAALEDQRALLTDDNLEDDNEIQDIRERGSIKLIAKERDVNLPQQKKAMILMLMKECFNEEGKFRYILINPIKFDGKRVNMSLKKLVKTSEQMFTDPNTAGLDNIQATFLQKSKLSEKHIKLDSEAFQRLLKKYAAQDENPRSFTDRRIDIALDYWYRKAAQVNQLLEAISFKISAVDRIFTFLETHQEDQQLTVFDDPNSLKFENEPVWNRRILENFQHGFSGRRDCADEGSLISRSSGSSSCGESCETEQSETPVDRIPSDFLKVMHTYFSLTTIETLKKEHFVDFPVPLETMYCYERMKRGSPSRQRRVPYNKMSLGGRISERHRVRVERRRELNKLGEQKSKDNGGRARCMGREDDPRTHVGFKSKCPVCHKMLVSHHPSLTLFIDFKTRHINEHRIHTEYVKPPKKGGYIKMEDPCTNVNRTNNNPNKKADTHDDCYLHCKVPTILSIFQGRSTTKNRQERLIRYFNRALHYEHAAVKDEITTRLNEEVDELDCLRHKQNYLRALHDTICERTCPVISQQIQALLSNQEMVMKFKKRTILSSTYCKKRTRWPLKPHDNMAMNEKMMASQFSHQTYPYTLTTNKISHQRKQLSRRLLNDLYICWLDAYSRGRSLLSEFAPQMRSNRIYPPDKFSTTFLNNIVKILQRSELASAKGQPKFPKIDVVKSPFEMWFKDFVYHGLLPKSSSSLNVANEHNMSQISSRFHLIDPSKISSTRTEDVTHEDAISIYSQEEDHNRHQEISSEDDNSKSQLMQISEGRLIVESSSDSAPDRYID